MRRLNNSDEIRYAINKIVDVFYEQVNWLLEYEFDYTKRQAQDILLKALVERYGKELKQ